MGLADHHRFQVLTKRSRRFRALLSKLSFRAQVASAMLKRDGDPTLADAVRPGDPAVWPLRSVWLGVSAEDEIRTRERLPLLADTPASHSACPTVASNTPRRVTPPTQAPHQAPPAA
jgi:protein gp37